jgi:predicted nucleotidyltransferase
MYKIIEYLKKEYNPLAIVVYGSYASGTNDEYSDFDCMIIVEEKSRKHDDSVINGIQLDCFIALYIPKRKSRARILTNLSQFLTGILFWIQNTLLKT